MLPFKIRLPVLTSASVKQVEGEIDKLSLEEAGFRNCVSVPDGAPAQVSKNLPDEREVSLKTS